MSNASDRRQAVADAGDEERWLHGSSYFGDVWVNFMRWNIKSIRNPFVLTVSLIQPIIFLVLFTQVFGSVATNALGGGPGRSVTKRTSFQRSSFRCR